MLNVSVFTGKLMRKPELRKDKRGEPLVNFCVRGEMGDVIPCFALGNTAKSISEMPTGAYWTWIAHIVAKPGSVETDDRFNQVTLRVVSWDNRYPAACETDSATSGLPM